MPQRRHSNRSLNWCSVGGRRRSRGELRRANAAPPPSRYAVSIESVSRVRGLAVDLHAVDDHLRASSGRPARPTSTSSRPTAWPSTSSRRNPRRRRLSSVSRSAVGRRRELPAPLPLRSAGVSVADSSPVFEVRRPAADPAPRRPASRSRSAAACPRGSAARRRATTSAVSRDDLAARTAGRTSGRRAPTAGACSRGSRSSCRRSSAGCGCCSSGGSRSPGRCPRCGRRRASPSARGTAGRRPTATRRSAAALRRRSCRRRATTCPTR